MHDLGKIAVDDAILRKPGKFTPEEYDMMKKHSEEGARIIHEIIDEKYDPYFKEIAENVKYIAVGSKRLVKDINYDVIYKYYKKINNEKKIRVIVNAKPDIKDTLKRYGLSYRKILSQYQKRSLDLNSICSGVNIQERTAKKMCDATGYLLKNYLLNKQLKSHMQNIQRQVKRNS